MYIDFVGVKPEMFISGLGGLIFMTPTGFQPTSGYKHKSVSEWLVKLLYKDSPPPTTLASDRKPTLHERNLAIRNRYADGETIADLARHYHISDQRIFQIIHGKRK